MQRDRIFALAILALAVAVAYLAHALAPLQTAFGY